MRELIRAQVERRWNLDVAALGNNSYSVPIAQVGAPVTVRVHRARIVIWRDAEWAAPKGDRHGMPSFVGRGRCSGRRRAPVRTAGLPAFAR